MKLKYKIILILVILMAGLIATAYIKTYWEVELNWTLVLLFSGVMIIGFVIVVFFILMRRYFAKRAIERASSLRDSVGSIQDRLTQISGHPLHSFDENPVMNMAWKEVAIEKIKKDKILQYHLWGYKSKDEDKEFITCLDTSSERDLLIINEDEVPDWDKFKKMIFTVLSSPHSGYLAGRMPPEIMYIPEKKVKPVLEIKKPEEEVE